MSIKIRSGVIAIGAFVTVIFAAVWATSHLSRPSGRAQAVAQPKAPAGQETRPIPAILTASGVQYALEVRSLGLVVNRSADDEIWQKIEKKADNFASILSDNPDDYADSADIRQSRYAQVSGFVFREAATRAVEYWPIPVIIWGPPKDPKNSYRAAVDISGNRQQAGLGVHLFLWADDANTRDGTEIIFKLFDFFEKNPDVPAALVLSEDGDVARFLSGPRGSMPDGAMVPTIPDSLVGLLVTRSDRVEKLIRPFAVGQPEDTGNDSTKNDVTRLWDYYWAKSDDQGSDGFPAFYRNEAKSLGYDDFTAVNTMSTSWWQQQLPALWKDIVNTGPGAFKPSPYIPVRWTTWQVDKFDEAPLIGYLHRPVQVKLTNAQGKPLRTAEQAAALRRGWADAVETLPPSTSLKRVFYDTTADRQWAVPITQALSHAGEGAPDIGDVKQGYDIGRRIGNTGISSPMVQLGLGLIAGYQEGGASATINRRPDGNATIIMVSPPDPATKAAWGSSHGGRSPF